MASFVNLMANDVWSEADIVNRTESMIAAEFSKDAAAILNRKATGQLLGQYTMTVDEKAEMSRYAALSDSAKQAGAAARADMAALQAALDYEAAQRRLAQPPYAGPAQITVINMDGTTSTIANPDMTADTNARNAAQAVVNGASAATLALVAQRKPPEPAPVKPTSGV